MNETKTSCAPADSRNPIARGNNKNPKQTTLPEEKTYRPETGKRMPMKTIKLKPIKISSWILFLESI